MKRIFPAILLAALCAATHINAQTNNDPGRHVHRGFYFSIGTGLIYTSVSRSIEEMYSDGLYNEDASFSGLISHDELRIGASIANTASIFAILGFSYGTGSYEDEMKLTGDRDKQGSFEEDNNEDYRFLFGVGGEFYPIHEEESPLYGVFFGISVGLVIDNVYYTDHSYDEVDEDETISSSFGNLFCRIEVGKEWWISRRWSVDVAINYSFGWIDGETGENNGHVDTESSSSHTIGLAFKIKH